MAHKQEQERETGRGGMLTAPYETLRGLAERMERFFESPWEAISEMGPRVEIEQTGKDIIVRARLPGYAREDVHVDVTDDSVTLRGSRSSESQSRRHGRASEQEWFSRTLTLPAPVKTGHVTASFKDGMLEVRMPRLKETSVRRVNVE
jgi:HSP20 family protein